MDKDIAVINSVSKWEGSTLIRMAGEKLWIESAVKDGVLFHGQIFLNDPIIKPVRMAMVKSWYLLKNQLSMRTKKNNPAIAPAATMEIISRSLLLTASRIY